MLSGKRKASAAEGERPSKKAQKSHAGKVKVVHLKNSGAAKLVVGMFVLVSNFRAQGLTAVATAPGMTIPSDLKFTSFSKKDAVGKSSLLLHSSEHPTIDYVGTESAQIEATEKGIKHYIAVFDPASGSLNVVEAKKMTVRSCVRVPDQESEDEDGEGRVPKTPSRAALTEAFGTKKSKRAVASMAENRLLARDADNAGDPVTAAILETIDDGSEDSDDSGISAPSAVRAHKPLPQVDTTAEYVTEVYPLSQLVHPAPYQTTLSQMPLGFWKDCLKKNKAVPTTLRFVATHVTHLGQRHLKEPNNAEVLQKLQLLRYIQLLVEIHKFISHQSRHKPLTAVERWPHGTTSDSSLSSAFKERILDYFFPTSVANGPGRTLLTSTILALTLMIPPPIWTPGVAPKYLFTEPTEITLDLALPQTEIHKLFRELGCRFETMTENELKKFGWEKVTPTQQSGEDGKRAKTPRPKFAKLKFPVEFPKVSSGRPEKRR